MYINGFVVPVPADNKDAYVQMARTFWDIARRHGAVSQMEAWEVDVADGHTTDFRKAVKIEDNEKVVFSWVIWPDKATADAAHAAMMEDPAMSPDMDLPFDGKRLIFGGFEPIFDKAA